MKQNNKKNNLKSILIVIFNILVILVIAFRVFGLKIIYPLDYSEYVEKYSDKNGLDKMLVYAIIKAESNFNPNITSSSGAIGLMQIMEETAEEIAQSLGIEYTSKEILFEPETNIMIGTKYFAELLTRYNSNINLALAAYNAGIGNVDKWIQNDIIKSDGSDIENIPFKETNNYVRKILRDYQMYKDIY